jgi:DNA (cytosine-5)-methyltransferase 1
MMPDQMLIRDVPEELYSWIRTERERTGKSQNQFILDVLKDAHANGRQKSLFSTETRVEIVPEALPFTFVDAFAGIGGMRLGLEKLGGRCVWSSEWDRWAQKTYFAWFSETPAGDIRKVDLSSIPNHDVLAAGFPCQPFSIAGVSKKKSLGRQHGFADQTQGTLFFHLARIVEAKRPPILFFENVKNLKSHDSGRTWEVIRSTLEGLRYRVFAKVIDAAGWVPQHRERFFIVGFDRDLFGASVNFEFPEGGPDSELCLRQILEPEPDPKYTLSDHLWKYLQAYAAKHREKGNGFGFGLANLDGISRTLSARYFKDGSEILIPQRGKNPRRLTPRECARLMGFEDNLQIVVSDTQAYRQFGNAVPPPVVQAVGRSITSVMAAILRLNSLLVTRIA